MYLLISISNFVGCTKLSFKYFGTCINNMIKNNLKVHWESVKGDLRTTHSVTIENTPNESSRGACELGALDKSIG